MKIITTRTEAGRGNTAPFLPLCMFVLVLFLGACGVSSDRFRLEGKFKNLNQGEFYIYSLEQGRKDTIAVRDGRFVYDVSLTDTVTFLLMFPNFSEMPIFARPGALVKIDGDVSHLKETKVTGTDENKEMTAFRIETSELMPPEVKERAKLFIGDHPQSVVSTFLLRRYFVQGQEPDYKEALDLCNSLLEAQPTNIALIQLHKQLETLQNLKGKGKLPRFSATDTKGQKVGNSQLEGKVNVILTWASWSFESQNILRQLKKIQKKNPKDLAIVSVCLDASTAEGRSTLERDSIDWPNVCDGKLWESAIVKQLSLTYVPDNIVADKDGNIVARSLKSGELKEKVESMLNQ
ncbi:MAG: AhpC/TSA family protein [Prevotella sp.]|nr:AhpC/TSA family protein [Prevotella sp.]